MGRQRSINNSVQRMTLKLLCKSSKLSRKKDELMEDFLARITHLHLNDKNINQIVWNNV